MKLLFEEYGLSMVALVAAMSIITILVSFRSFVGEHIIKAMIERMIS